MFSRKEQTKKGAALPDHWCQKAKEAFNKRFAAFGEFYEFFVVGEAFEDELVLIISAVSRSLEKSPISFFLSQDLDGKLKKDLSENSLEKSLELVELFFEEVFDTDNWSDYHSRWCETTHSNKAYYYKVTRENIYLTLEANKILEEETHS